jgi:hypothetical protein
MGEMICTYKIAVSKGTEGYILRKLPDLGYKSVCVVNQHAPVKLKRREVACSEHSRVIVSQMVSSVPVCVMSSVFWC